MRASIVLAGFAFAGVLGAALSACDQLKRGGEGDEMRWARAALDRNSALTVVAEDDRARVFTVRMTGSGELHALTLAQIVAGPQDAPPTAADATPTDNAPVAPVAQAPAQLPSAAAHEAAPPAGPTAPEAPSPQGSADAASSAPPAPAGSRVLASGPGYSIAAASGLSARGARVSTTHATAEQSLTPGQRTVAQKRSDPIICQGNRRLRIDGQNLEFSGDAVTAESGCDLHITNSRIVANGVAVSARAANVHIENSTIEGNDSIDASDGAQVYVQASIFKGLSRRLDSAQLHDLGGNLWN